MLYNLEERKIKMKEKEVVIYIKWGAFLAVPNFKPTEEEVDNILSALSVLAQRGGHRIGILNGEFNMRMIELNGE